MENKSYSTETPYFDRELTKWLTLYFIGTGHHKFPDVSKNMEKILGQKIVLLDLVKIISQFDSGDCIGTEVRNEPTYKKEGDILKYLGDAPQDYYFLTPKGKEQLLFEWEFAASAIPKEFYVEISKNLGFICES